MSVNTYGNKGVMILFLIQCLPVVLSEISPDHAGKEFIICPVPLVNSGQEFQILAAAAIPSISVVTARIRNPLMSPSPSKIDSLFNIQPSTRAFIKITNYEIPTMNEKNTGAIVITSDTDLVVFVTIYKSNSSGSAVMSPVDAAGLSYVAIVHSPNISNADKAFLVIAAAYDNTDVDITFKGDPSLQVTIAGTQYHHSDTYRLHFTNQYENFILSLEYDITGTAVESTKPVSVWSGNQELSINNDGIYDATYEQLSPVAAWGNNHIVVANQRATAEIIKIVTATANNNVYIDDTLYTLTNAGDHIHVSFSLVARRHFVINATSQVQVAKFGPSRSNLDNIRTDASMAIVQPLKRYGDNYIVMTTANDMEYSHKVTIISEKGTSLMVGGSVVNGIGWTPIYDADKGIDYQYVYVDLTEGYTILSTDPSSKHTFGGYVFGTGLKESYSCGFAKVTKTSWNVQKPVIMAKFRKKTVDEIPYSDPFDENTQKTLMDCTKYCSKLPRCGVIARLKTVNSVNCKYYELETIYSPLQKAEGYNLYVRDRYIE